MPNTFINLVATRCKDGNHDMLLRWYHDHVHILFRFEALQQASLLRNTSAAPGAAPPYICLYEFPSESAFDAFETGEPREAARQVLLAGWGKDGIEITHRTQFERFVHLHHGPSDQVDDTWTVEQLSVEPALSVESARWFNDRAHAVYGPEGFAGASILRSAKTSGAHSSVLALGQLKATLSSATHAPHHVAPKPFGNSLGRGPTDAWGSAPEQIHPLWHGSYQRLRTWLR